MQIKPVSNKIYIGNEISDNIKDKKEVKENNIQDKLELSEEARNIQKSQVPLSKLDKIKERINSKFYNSDEVISQVADKLLKDIENE